MDRSAPQLCIGRIHTCAQTYFCTNSIRESRHLVTNRIGSRIVRLAIDCPDSNDTNAVAGEQVRSISIKLDTVHVPLVPTRRSTQKAEAVTCHTDRSILCGRKDRLVHIMSR